MSASSRDVERHKLRVPRSLDDPPRLLWLDFDQALLALCCVGLGVALGSLMLGLAAGVTVAATYGKMRAGRHRMYGLHFLYWHLPPCTVRFKRTPPSYRRMYCG